MRCGGGKSDIWAVTVVEGGTLGRVSEVSEDTSALR